MNTRNTYRGRSGWLWRGAGLVLAGLLVAAVSAPGTAPARAQASVLRIGYLGTAGTDLANGAQLAIDQINAAGGLAAPDGSTYQLELITLAAPPSAESLATDLIALASQNVVALLGPDDNSTLTPENVQALVAKGLPVFTGATADTLTASDTADVLLRVRAPDQVTSYALATYLLDDLGLTSLALVQTDIDSTEALLDFEAVLAERGVVPGAKVQMAGAAGLPQQARALLDLNPEAVVMWGPYADAANLLGLLLKGGWAGRFAYRHADEAARAGILKDDQVAGLIGVTSWSYAYPGRAARVFLKDYLVTFGEVPGALAAAGYDAIWLLRSAILSGGTDRTALRGALMAAAPQALVSGTLRPAELGNGDLVHTAMVYELGPGGGPTVAALFDGTQRLPVEDAGN